MIMIKNAWKLWWYAQDCSKKTYSEWLCLYGSKGKKALWCGYLTVHKKKMHYYYDDEYHRGIIVDVVVVIIIICFFSSSLVLRGVRRKVLHATSPVYSLYSMIVVCVVTSYYGLVEMMVVWFCSGYCSFSDLSLLYRDFSNYKIGIKRVKLRERKKWKTRFSLKNKMIFFSSPVMTSLSPSCTL